MSNSRRGVWIVLALAAVGLPLVAISGMWVFMKATARPPNPNPQEAPSVSNSDPPPKWAGAVEQGREIVRTSLSENYVPGLSVAVGIDGEIVWAEGFGFADIANRVSVTPNHRFRIGTASTVLTSAAVGLLIEDSRLKLDDVIQTYVRAFPKKPWPVTLRQLMGHLSGVRNDGGDEGPLFGEHCARPDEAFRHFAELPLLFEPGMRFSYSSYGWIVVSAAVEAAAGESLFAFMRAKIFEPLGMGDTRPDSAMAKVADTVTQYFPRFASDPKYGLHLMRDVDYSCYSGSSAFLSTPSDLVRFGTAINAGKLLKPATVQLLQTSQKLTSGEETGYGLGWDLETIVLNGKQTRVAGHDGDCLGGRVASLVTFPEFGIVVSVMSNISYTDTFSLAVKLGNDFAQRAGSAKSVRSTTVH